MPGFFSKCYNPLRRHPVRWGDHIRPDVSKILDPQRVLDQVRLNVTTEEDILAFFGPDFYLRNRFDPPFPARYFGHYYPVDKLIVYNGADVGVVRENGFTSYTNRGRLTVAFYFYRGVVKYFSINSRVRTPEGRYEYGPYTTPDVLADEFAANWPDAVAYGRYYEVEVLGVPESWANYSWRERFYEEPGFEEKLRADGYYERVEKGYTVEMRMPPGLLKEQNPDGKTEE